MNKSRAGVLVFAPARSLESSAPPITPPVLKASEMWSTGVCFRC